MSSEESPADAHTTVAEVAARLRRFNRARDWEQFHTPKDLAVALSVEAGELLEAFLWKREGDALDQQAIEEELADVLICAVNLAQRLSIDLMAAVDRKIDRNAERYPVAQARGSADKHDVLARRARERGEEPT
ncbi:MAG: nucleotide pyrophosphohydrolase [Myxococcota bacterium]